MIRKEVLKKIRKDNEHQKREYQENGDKESGVLEYLEEIVFALFLMRGPSCIFKFREDVPIRAHKHSDQDKVESQYSLIDDICDVLCAW